MTEKVFIDFQKACEEAGKSLKGFVLGLQNNAHSVPGGILHEGPFNTCPINCCVASRRAVSY